MKILDTGRASAKKNMAIDKELLNTLDTPTLHLYDWEAPSATYGYFINPYDYLLETTTLDLARRPTGGGIIFHTHDFAFSLLLPTFSQNTLENYAFVNALVAKALSRLTGATPALLQEQSRPDLPFCMAKPTIYDVLLEGKKVGGAAQRKTKKGLLHQGSINLSFPPEEFLKKHLKSPEKVIEAMRATSYSLPNPIKAKDALRELLIEEIRSQSWT